MAFTQIVPVAWNREIHSAVGVRWKNVALCEVLVRKTPALHVGYRWVMVNNASTLR